jgi:hypothetical protein
MEKISLPNLTKQRRVIIQINNTKDDREDINTKTDTVERNSRKYLETCIQVNWKF